MSNIALSVVIPTYNRSASLRVTLEGLARQTYQANLFEVIVVSDGSTDDTSHVVEIYKSAVSNAVRFIDQPNSGPSVARNRGVAESSNEVIVFLDDDVEPVPEFLERHAVWHSRGPRYAVIGPMSPDRMRSQQEPAWITWEHDKLERIYQFFRPGGQYPDGHGGPTHFYSGNVSIRRTWLQQSGGFDTRYSRQEDVELATRLSKVYGIQFFFDFEANGFHRPTRTFKSWIKIPRDYGRLDAQRIADNTETYDGIAANLENRHALSRALMNAAMRGSILIDLSVGVLTLTALTASRLKAKKLALTALSGLYHAVYCRAFFREYKKSTPELKMPAVNL